METSASENLLRATLPWHTEAMFGLLPRLLAALSLSLTVCACTSDWGSLRPGGRAIDGSVIACDVGYSAVGGTCVLGTCDPGYALVPGGDYLIGSDASDPDRQPDEFPQWTAALSPFCMKVTEVTVAEFGACRSGGRCLSDPLTGMGCNWNVAGRSNHPINCVDWNQAVDYCAWSGGRLATEAEWEGAARGPTWRLFPWGGTPPTVALANSNNVHGATQNVGMAGQDRCNNPFGLCDMAGNVWEWVNDCEAPYPTGRVVDPRGPTGPGCTSATPRVSRGGGWFDSGNFERASNRFRGDPSLRDAYTGLRCARGVR